jgi:hypothetical protein
MNLCNDLIKHGMEFSRAIDRHQFEVSPAGIFFPKQKAFVGGCFRTRVNGRDLQIDPNVVPIEALDYLLKIGYKTAAGALASWYIGLFQDDVNPSDALTAANADATLNEFTAYTQTTRVQWVLPTNPTTGAYDNSASPAVFTADGTVDPDDGVDIYGAFIISASAKLATTGKIGPAGQFSSGLRNLKPTDTLSVGYELSATSA